MEVLVVEAHERELDALEFARLTSALGGAEAQLADLLPIGVGRRAFSDAGNLQNLLAQVALRACRCEAGPSIPAPPRAETAVAPLRRSRRLICNLINCS